MPQTIINATQLTTQELLQVIEEALTELKARKIDETYSDDKTRGGVRPTTQPLNP